MSMTGWLDRRTCERRPVAVMVALALTLSACSDPDVVVILELEDVTLNPGQVVKTTLMGASADDRAGSEGYLLSIDKPRRVEWILYPATEPSRDPEPASRPEGGLRPTTLRTMAFPADLALYYTIPAEADPGEMLFCRGLLPSTPDDAFCARISVVAS